MHHLLWEPRLGAPRFFNLYCETWRRSILNLNGRKSWLDWARQVRVRDLPSLTGMLLRTQRMMHPDAYLREHRLVERGSRALPFARRETQTDRASTGRRLPLWPDRPLS
jgi:hypothetical protein